jgi:hypothetical protein
MKDDEKEKEGAKVEQNFCYKEKDETEPLPTRNYIGSFSSNLFPII